MVNVLFNTRADKLVTFALLLVGLCQILNVCVYIYICIRKSQDDKRQRFEPSLPTHTNAKLSKYGSIALVFYIS